MPADDELDSNHTPQCAIQINDPESVLNGQTITTPAGKKSPDGKTNVAYAALRDEEFSEAG